MIGLEARNPPQLIQTRPVAARPIGKNLTVLVVLKSRPEITEFITTMRNERMQCGLGTLSCASGVSQ